MADIRLTVRVDFGSDRVLGPGKIRLLEEIGRSGSISQAGRSLKMSYRRAWLLVDDLNRCFRSPVVTTQPGGAHGGGAAVTALGQKLINEYRSIVARAMAATEPQLRGLEASLSARGVRGRKPLKESGRATKAGR